MADALRWMPMLVSLRSVRRVMWALLTALVLLQTVGVMHRVAHAQQSAGVSVHVAAETSGGWGAIWGEHSNASECQLFDQCCPDVWHVPTLGWLFAPVMAVWVPVVWNARLVQTERFYATRGPPL